MGAGMTRRHDWPERVVAVLDRAQTGPFEWGKSDCFTLTMDVVEAVSGEAHWSSERGRYTTAIGAARRLKANGFDDLEAFVGSLGREIPASFARRGDLGIVPTEGGPAAVVCDGMTWVGRADGVGFVRLPRASALRAWRIV